MFAVSISLGSTSAYVSVAPVNPSSGSGEADGALASAAAPIRVIANSAGHRHTPVVAALTEQEVLFGENAVHTYVRQPQKVVPYLFSFTAAAAASSDAVQSKSGAAAALASQLLEAVEQGARTKYRGHCALAEHEVSDGIQSHGFHYEAEGPNGEAAEKFASAEDLFVQFLNYVKEHSVDGACGRSAGDSNDTARDGQRGKEKSILLTIVVPRSAFPTVAARGIAGAKRADATEWLADAVRASQLGDVAIQTTILFRDEAALLAFDSAPRRPDQPRPYFLLPPSASGRASAAAGSGSSQPQPADTAQVLVVDWGAQSLCFTLLRTSGGVLVRPKAGVPFMCCAGGCGGGSAEDAAAASYYYPGGGGGDAIDVSLADKVAANYMIANRRMFQSLVPNMRPLQELINASTSAGSGASGSAAAEAERIVAETIPSRAMRKLRLLMGEKKIALNTNPQASSVSVEMDAFYEGMDLMDSQSLSRNKFEAAVIHEWQCIERFEAALGEFVRRHPDVFSSRKIDHVLLTGGMLQVPSVVQGVRRVLQAPRNKDVQSALSLDVAGGVPIKVLDASAIGNGVAADELFSVGGCLNSCHLAHVTGTKRKTAARLAEMQQKARRTVAARINAEALRERHSALGAAWSAMTEIEGDDEDSDGGSSGGKGNAADTEDPAESHAHALLLKRGVYLYTGRDPAADVKCSASAPNAAVPRPALATLFAKGTALPARVACPLPASGAEDSSDVVLYLFADRGAVGPSGEVAEVCPLTEEGLRVSLSGAPAPQFVVFTLHTDAEGEGRRGVAISVHKVSSVGARNGVPVCLHPGNTTAITEITLR